MKILSLIKNNLLLAVALFFIVFIPLYPKLPLLDVSHTWVYVRIEDFLVAVAAFIFLVQLLRKKVTLQTPLTMPIIVFWIVGAIATIHGVLFLFPNLPGVFPQIALLHYLRHIEYLLLFFIGFAAIRDKKLITPIVVTFAVTLLLVVLYGVGQRYLGFPAFLTMNEEFAKGIPLKLSALSRVPSTFAGHYDLAAYLILMIPFLGSMSFGYKKWWAKVFFVLTSLSGLILLMMTASRVSFVVYLLAISFMLILQKKKILIIPVIIVSIILLQGFQGLSQRFASTFTQVDLVVDARTGQTIGIAENYTEGEEIVLKNEESTGENLPQGSKFVQIPTKQQESQEVYLRTRLKDGSGKMIGKSGNVIVKKAFAYDVSYTTRLQGTWPRAFQALQRNYLLGSGYSSINIASDNNYLRILGEIGLLGFFAFLSIFLFFFIYAWKVLPHIEDRKIRSLVYGVSAGVFGLMLNAILIDVFEASKVAFILWLLIGITVGFLHLYQKEKIHYLSEVKRILLSTPALLLYLFLGGLFLFAPSFGNYFVGDDFTWLRWAADCTTVTQNGSCLPFLNTIQQYFIDAQGFFYRPGTKTYFYLMYPFFELFPSTYHLVSYLLHFAATVLIFLIFAKILNSRLFAFLGALLFLTLSVHAEAVYWISVTGHLVSFNCALFALLLFMYWRENRNIILFLGILVSLFVGTFFYEFAVVAPLLLIGYDLIMEKKLSFKVLKLKWFYPVFLLLIPLYYIMRTAANSFWMQGDYSYSLVDLPFNFAGNLFGYFLITILGTSALNFYTALRTTAVQQIPLVIVGILIGLTVLGALGIAIKKYATLEDRKILLLSLMLFVIPLLPFLGFGNIAPRYVYLGSVGVVLFVVFLLQKVASVVSKKQRAGALVLIGILSLVYITLNIIQLREIHKDWKYAGDITNNLLTNLSLTYGAPDALPSKPVFYFVNVPIRYGDAWVFPVGLPDAMWFAFREKPVEVKQTLSLEEALSARDNSRSVSAFEFLPDGSVVVVNRNPNLNKNE